MRNYLFLLVCLLPCIAFAGNTDTLFDQLNRELGNKASYDNKKEAGIQKLKRELKAVQANDLQGQFTVSAKLYGQYKAYQYDSAYVYVSKMLDISQQLKDRPKYAQSKVEAAFILLSSGMFKETFDNLKGIDENAMDDSVRIAYFSLLTRAYYDMASYDNDKHYSAYYNELANKYIDSAIALSKPDSYEKIYLTGYKELKQGDGQAAVKDLTDLLDHHKLTMHQVAIVASTLSNLYVDANSTEHQQRIHLLIKATIADIRTSTKETVALFWLAQQLYKDGDIQDTYYYLQQALNDADFYGARQRKIQIGTLLPIVAAEKLNYTEREKTRFLIYLASTTALTLLIIVVLVLLFKQFNKLKIKEKIIDDKNIQLEKINEKLIEGTKIKEEYIGYFFDVISGYILQLEKLKRTIDMKLSVKKYDDIQLIIDRINIKRDRDKLFHTFDHVFLKIFPHFINDFNALFHKEDQIWPKEDEVLTTDLRIFALIRIGIHDTETIAKILEYSEKTIYVYKMRMKAKAINPGDQFDHDVMDIKAVDGK